MAKKEKVKIIHCEQCIYWSRMGESADGVCKVSPYHAYRKHNQFCEKAIKRREHGL